MRRSVQKGLGLLCVFVLLLSSQLVSKHQQDIKVNANQEKLVTTFTPSTIASTSTYRTYENDQWLLTMGNNNGVGASNTYASNLTLGTYVNLMAFDSSITNASQYLSALVYKEPISNLSSISLSRGNSNGAFLSTKVYLVSSGSLNGAYKLVKEIESINTNVSNYTFSIVEGRNYFALVFYNSSGSFLIGGLNLSFYASDSLSYSKITNNHQLYFGATYTLVDESEQKVMTKNPLSNGYVGNSISIDNSQFESEDEVLKLRLEIGVDFSTYAFSSCLDNETKHYLSLSKEGLKWLDVNDQTCALTINNGKDDNLLGFDDQFLSFDRSDGRFTTSANKSTISLYRLNQEVNHLEEVKCFSNQVFLNGENAKEKCEETYLYLLNVYERLSKEAQEIYQHSTTESDISSKVRMAYLEGWYENSKNNTKNISFPSHEYNHIFIGLGLSFIIILLHAFAILKKTIKKHN